MKPFADALNTLSGESRDRLKECNQPGFLQPMKAVLTHAPFDDADWLYERKFDGVRCLAHKQGNKVKLYSRNRKERQLTYPEITAAFSRLPGDFIVDCEIVAFANNVTDFSRLQRRMQVRKPDRDLVERVPVFAYVFDILAGRVGTGFSDAVLESMHQKLVRRRRKTCPFADS